MALAFVLSALVFFLWRCKKRRRQDLAGIRLPSSISLDKIAPGVTEKPELDSKTVPILSSDPSELQGERDVAEMAVPHFVAELPGSMPLGYQERRNSGQWSVSPADTVRASESMTEPSPMSETSDSRIGGMSIGTSLKETPILSPVASEEGTLQPSDDSGMQRGRSTWRESSSIQHHLTSKDRPR